MNLGVHVKGADVTKRNSKTEKKANWAVENM